MKLIFLVVMLACISLQAQVDEKPASTPAPAAAQAPAPQVRRVEILLTATDRSGKPLEKLTKDQLSIVDNDAPAEILDLRSANPIPLHLAFVFLASKTNFSQQQTAAIELAHNVLRPNIDAAFVLTARGDKPWPNPQIQWQTDPNSIEQAIRSLEKNSGLNDPFQFDMSTDNANENRHMTLLHYGGSGPSLFNVLWTMMKADPTPARHAVVIFRDPWAHSPGFGGIYTRMVDENHVQLIADAQHLWSAFYIVGVEEPQPVSTELSQVYAPTKTGAGGYNRVYDQRLQRARDRAYGQGKANVERIATETGGGIWWSTKKNYPDAVTGIGNAVQSQYDVTYSVSAVPSAGSEHLLQVKSNDPNVRVTAQKTYFSRQTQAPAQPPAVPVVQPRQPDSGIVR